MYHGSLARWHACTDAEPQQLSVCEREREKSTVRTGHLHCCRHLFTVSMVSDVLLRDATLVITILQFLLVVLLTVWSKQIFNDLLLNGVCVVTWRHRHTKICYVEQM